VNLVLLKPEDYIASDIALVRGYRCKHLRTILKVQPGDELRVGLLNGLMGQGYVESVDEVGVSIRTHLTTAPPPPLDVHLVLALPRPLVLKRLLNSVTTFGVKKITLLHTARVEKSFWQSPVLEPQKIEEQLMLGLEQTKDTLLPEIIFAKKFKVFIEQQLPHILKTDSGNNRLALIAHPRTQKPFPMATNQPCALFIGPEGGFLNHEIDQLEASGCTAASLGERILKVEVATHCLLGRFYSS